MEPINWPITTGCDQISEGCNSCPSYWEAVKSGESYAVKEHWEELSVPQQMKTPMNYLVSFGSDLFHEDVSVLFIAEVFKVMNKCQQHIFEILTKRSERALDLASKFEWTPNIYFGVSIELAETKYKIDHLRKMPAAFKTISMVPILGPMGDLNLHGIDLVCATKETWGYKRPCDQQWIDDIKKQCAEQGVVFSAEHVVYEKEAV